MHPGLAPVVATLARVAPILPVETARASDRLAETLRPITHSIWPEISHRLSLLTNTGIPVEFSWSTRHTALRWTVEVAGPETPKEQRLSIAADLAGVDAGWLQAIQDGQRVRYGAWLGGRHLTDTDELKVYGEFPAGAPAVLPVHHPAVDDLDVQWRIAGIATDGSLELYGRGQFGAAEIDACEHAAFGTTGALRAAVTDFLGGEDAPRPALVSIAIDRHGDVDTLTWFGFAERVFAGHEATVAALEQRCPDATRRALLQALTSGPADAKWRIGLIGVRLGADGATSVQAAIRPT